MRVSDSNAIPTLFSPAFFGLVSQKGNCAYFFSNGCSYNSKLEYHSGVVRNLALDQPGYIPGETLKKLHTNESLSSVISGPRPTGITGSRARKETRLQDKMDSLIGGKTEYKIFSPWV